MAKGRNQINQAIDAGITDPLNNQITPAIVRQILKLITEGFYNKVDDEISGGTFPDGYIARAGFGYLEAGTNLGGVSAIDAIIDATTPPFAQASISINATSPIEKGLNTNINVSGTISLNDVAANQISNRRVEKGGAAWQTPASDAFNYADTVKAQTTYAYKADTPNGTIQANVTVAAFAPSYHDSTAMGGLTEGIAKTGTKQIWGPQGSRAITFTNNNSKPYFAEPKSNGARNRIMDQNGFNVTAAFDRTEIVFTLADGVTTEEMYLYLKREPAGNGSAFVYTFYNN